MGPVPAYFYAAGQLMDYAVHSWDVREGMDIYHAMDGEAADLLVPFMFVLWVLTAFGRINAGSVRGDMALADRFLNLFHRI
jgi:hypothetical protein